MSTQEETTLKTTPRATRKDEGLEVWILRKDARTKDLNKSKRFDVSFWCRESITARCESELFPFYFASFSYSSICALIFLRLIVKNWAHKKSSSLSTARLHQREEKVSEILHFPPHARTKIHTNFAKTYLDVVERPFTEEFHFLRGEFSHTISIYFMRVVVVVMLFLGFSRSKPTKNFGTSDFLDFWQNRSKIVGVELSSFFLWFLVGALWCSLREEFVLLLWLALLLL